MSTYVIGDVQGCFVPLQELLQTISFNSAVDCLWFVGDLVNRGPQSLEVLRFIKNLPNVKVVLGNHDLHLLTLACGYSHPNHTLETILKAPDCEELITWLRQQPLIYHDEKLNYVMVHAGILPQWNLSQAQQYANEVAVALQSKEWKILMPNLYGDKPKQWHDNLTGWERLRFITNVFTRMRFCTLQGELEFAATGKMTAAPVGYLPWFKVPERQMKNIPIVFGHWAALEGVTEENNAIAIDTGCGWGNSLTAMRLEDQRIFSVPCVRSKITKL